MHLVSLVHEPFELYERDHSKETYIGPPLCSFCHSNVGKTCPFLQRLAIVGGTNVMALMVRETALAAHASVLLTQSTFFEYLPFWPLLVLVISFLLCLGWMLFISLQ